MAIKVLVVDDSMMMRKMIKDIIGADSGIEVIGDANNGEVGLKKTVELKPDVVLLDIEMPVMTGLEYLAQVKAVSDVKVIILSSLAQEGSAASAKALELGAVATVPKPSGGVSLDLKQKKGHEIIATIKKVAGVA
jgi:two-component system chemotaxis response regulator CheB